MGYFGIATWDVSIFEKLQNSRIQYFPNDESHKMWQNNTMVKHLFQLQDKKMDFNVTDYKNLIDVSNSTFQLTF